jgi:phage gp45-like
VDNDVVRFIREEIRKQVNVILMAKAGETTFESEDLQDLFAGMPTITKRPVMQPFGVASRAPTGTRSVIGRVGEHFGARMVLGHQDQAKPDYHSVGETVLYNQFGQAIYLKSGSVHIGKPTTSNPAVVGNETKALFQALIQWILTHTHITTAPGSQTTPTFQASDLTSILNNNVENDKILSQLVFLEKDV